MSVLAIKTNLGSSVFPIINLAIEREKSILRHSVQASHRRIKRLSARLAVDPEQLLAGNVPHADDQDFDLLELEGELMLLKRHESQLAELGNLIQP